MIPSILFPNISPIAVSIGFIDIRWYSLSYIVSAILIFIYLKILNRDVRIILLGDKKKFFDDALFYLLLGILIGGRLGFVIFYGFSYYINNLVKILYIWEGGMSYHGALVGGLIACYLLAQKYKKPLLNITDIIVPGVPIGLFLGRIANFINGELYGHRTDLPWGVVFNNVSGARHPSQLYEAILEGLVLFIILAIMWSKHYYNDIGKLTGYFLLLYSLFRIFVEFFREGEIYFYDFISMGQLLTLPMLLIGFILILRK